MWAERNKSFYIDKKERESASVHLYGCMMAMIKQKFSLQPTAVSDSHVHANRYLLLLKSCMQAFKYT